MLGHEALTKLDDVAGLLLRLAEQRTAVGDEAGAMASSEAADHLLDLLDLDALRTREPLAA
ncbi:hypothetical protein [Methylobacterium sp. J-076]|uniref:hypothetical protein n=1 Tax=Methylobacterium sp. J-076 TaxID=2836655 RepID=UPI001FB8FE4A|nr:hypothetical protein [Methylobacterium sp. J-076]MCJ2012173.1 hypothetical protein [Methylobacterium sp. J-076]